MVYPDKYYFSCQSDRGRLAFSERNKLPSRFRRACVKNIDFLRFRGNRQFVALKGLTHTQTSRALQMQDDFRWKLYKCLSKRSMKTLWEHALWRLSESRTTFTLYESRMTFIERSTKAGSRDLRKQDDFRWELYESRRTFFESSTKAELLLLKVLQKQDDFR